MLDTNVSKICFWQRVCSGLYRLGDIEVRQIYHNTGICAGTNMWHVQINGETFISWPYLKDAKKTAHQLDRIANGN